MFNLRTICVSALLVSAAAAATTVALRPAASQEMPKPTKQHETLMKQIGEWEGTLEMFVPGMEGKNPATDTVTAFGPFWTQSNFECTFEGMPMSYQGSGNTGFDPSTGEFVGTWIHNTDPHIAVMRGKADEKTGALEMHWQAPIMGTDMMGPHRSVTVFGEDEYEMKFYMGEGEQEMHHMTIAMKRKKN